MILQYAKLPWYQLLATYLGLFSGGPQDSQKPSDPAGCLCANTKVVPVTSQPCGDVIKDHTYGACWESGGVTRVCEGETWQQLDYGAGRTAWVRASQVEKSADEKCSGSGGHCSSVQMVTRAEWGARSPKATTPHNPPLSIVFIHHTQGASCNTLAACKAVMRGIQDFHMDDRGWDDIGYSFLVGGDGRVYEGRGWDILPAQCKGHNAESYGVSIMGSFQTVLPPPRALQAVKDIIDCGIQKGKVTIGHEEFGHRDGRCTDCPGDALYAEINTWPRYSHRPIPRTCP